VLRDKIIDYRGTLIKQQNMKTSLCAERAVRVQITAKRDFLLEENQTSQKPLGTALIFQPKGLIVIICDAYRPK